MEKEKRNVTNQVEETKVTSKKLRHVVMFKFKEGTSDLDIQRVEKAFALLPSKIKEIKAFEWGLNNSPENLNKDFSHGFLLTFDSEKGRDVYLPHPDHKAFVTIVEPVLEDVMVFDYWTE
ncbi:Dabb family protein [Lutimonas sp.]|uniref:Dabb family protein n=1 Tax=Lutimonas sp. TaxID=1872403 RepID=UPI003D9ABF2E